MLETGRIEVRQERIRGEDERDRDEHHLDDVARMLRISRALIDQATLDGWIARAGVTREWREVLDRLVRMG